MNKYKYCLFILPSLIKSNSPTVCLWHNFNQIPFALNAASVPTFGEPDPIDIINKSLVDFERSGPLHPMVITCLSLHWKVTKRPKLFCQSAHKLLRARFNLLITARKLTLHRVLTFSLYVCVCVLVWNSRHFPAISSVSDTARMRVKIPPNHISPLYTHDILNAAHLSSASPRIHIIIKLSWCTHTPENTLTQSDPAAAASCASCSPACVCAPPVADGRTHPLRHPPIESPSPDSPIITIFFQIEHPSSTPRARRIEKSFIWESSRRRAVLIADSFRATYTVRIIWCAMPECSIFWLVSSSQTYRGDWMQIYAKRKRADWSSLHWLEKRQSSSSICKSILWKVKYIERKVKILMLEDTPYKLQKAAK